MTVQPPPAGSAQVGQTSLIGLPWTAQHCCERQPSAVAAHASWPVVFVRGETAGVHQRADIGIGDLDTCADSPAFAFQEASPRQASLMAIHALHTPKTAISRAGSASPVPGLAAIEAEAARQLARLLDNWRKKYPDVLVSQAVEYAPGPRADRPVSPRRPGGPWQARQSARPARSRFSQARRPEPRARSHRGSPVVLTPPGEHGKPAQPMGNVPRSRVPLVVPGLPEFTVRAARRGR